MSESLEVKDFLVIKKAAMELRKFNFIIGPQASGKSILAKLTYFFREVIRDAALENADGDFLLYIEQKFQRLFPSSSWGEPGFKIAYKCDGHFINVKRLKGRPNLKIEVSEDIKNFFVQLKKQLARMAEEGDSRMLRYKAAESSVDLALSSGLSSFFQNNDFFPASRSVFAQVKENVFTFLSQDVGFDSFMTELGRIFERTRFVWEYTKDKKESLKLKKEDSEVLSILEGMARDILFGEYVYEDKADWIKMKHARVKLVNASSGQQESLPVVLALSLYPLARSFLYRPGKRNGKEETNFFIEEPEAHLFPEAQEQIIRMCAILYNVYNSSFFITTHSPYVLTAINNLIMAGNVIEVSGTSAKVGIEKIIGKYAGIKFSDVSAYALVDNCLVDIRDKDTALINADIIDFVSEDFAHDFDRLLDLIQSKRG